MQTQMVRTTVYLPADLMALAKMSALNRGSTLTGLMQNGLIKELELNTISPKKFMLKTYKLGIGKFNRSMAYDLT